MNIIFWCCEFVVYLCEWSSVNGISIIGLFSFSRGRFGVGLEYRESFRIMRNLELRIFLGEFEDSEKIKRESLFFIIEIEVNFFL